MQRDLSVQSSHFTSRLRVGRLRRHTSHMATFGPIGHQHHAGDHTVPPAPKSQDAWMEDAHTHHTHSLIPTSHRRARSRPSLGPSDRLTSDGELTLVHRPLQDLHIHSSCIALSPRPLAPLSSPLSFTTLALTERCTERCAFSYPRGGVGSPRCSG